MPGSTAAFSFSSVRATTRPASRMSAISLSLLYWIMRAPSAAVGPQRRDRPVGHVVDGPHRVDTDEQTLLRVVADERRGLLVVDLEPVPDRLRLVVVALEQLTAAAVAHTLRRRRVEVQMPDVPAVTAGAAPGQPAYDLVVVDHELEHHVERRVRRQQQVVEGLGLRHVAREAVEQEALGRVVLREPVA